MTLSQTNRLMGWTSEGVETDKRKGDRLEMRGLSTFSCIGPNSPHAGQESRCGSLSLSLSRSLSLSFSLFLSLSLSVLLSLPDR